MLLACPWESYHALGPDGALLAIPVTAIAIIVLGASWGISRGLSKGLSQLVYVLLIVTVWPSLSRLVLRQDNLDTSRSDAPGGVSLSAIRKKQGQWRPRTRV